MLPTTGSKPHRRRRRGRSWTNKLFCRYSGGDGLRSLQPAAGHCRFLLLQEDEDSYTVTSASNTAVSYHVDMSIGCCTCPAGVMGGHCKHQSAVTRTFGHATEDGLSLGLPPEARKLCYQIATGVFVFTTTKQPSAEAVVTVSFLPPRRSGHRRRCFREVSCLGGETSSSGWENGRTLYW